MEATERLVRTWMTSNRDEEVVQIVADITAGETSLLNVVKVSGEYLTSEESQQRSKGVELLSLVLERLPPSTFARPITRTLVNFYCDKLDDSDTIIPALQGLYTLATIPTFSGVEAATTIQSLTRHVKTKALSQTHRFKVYSIVDSLIANHRDVLKSMGLKFLDGYIFLVDGEKDPRNLLIVFAMNKVILIEFDISERVQTMYDIVFCYFPISFRPPPNNPGGITADDLRAALRQCVSATPLFGGIAIPNFLENLVSGSRAAKKDTLDTLITCLPVYGHAIARDFARKLWNSLKLEVFQPVDRDTEAQALVAIQVLIKTIYTVEGVAPADQDMQGLARDACEECIKILREPEKSQARPATKVLCSFMTTTANVSRYTISKAIPHLTKLFINPDEATSRPATLILLSEFIEAARDSHIDSDIPLAPYKDEVLGVLSSGLKVHSLRLPALVGLKGLITTNKLLTDEEIGFVVHSINEIIQDHPDEFEDVSEGSLELLSSISEVSPSHVVEKTLPLLFSSLPDQAPPRDAVEQRAQSWKTLSALQALCKAPTLFETLVIRLTTKLELLCSPLHQLTDCEPTAAYGHAILKTLANTLSAKVQQGDVDVPKYVERLVSRLFNLFIYGALEASADKPMVATEPRLLEVAAEVITLVVRTLPSQRQEVYLRSIFQALTSGNVASISEGHFKIPSDRSISIFQSGATTSTKNLLILFTAAAMPVYKDVGLGLLDINIFLRDMFQWCINTAENDLQRTAAMHLISVLVNRKSSDIPDFLQYLLDKAWTEDIISTSRTPVCRRWALSVWAWVSKALLVQNCSLAFDFAERLFDAFGESDINWHAAKAIGLIPGHDSILTKPNHAVLRILYAQKYVNRILPRTISGAKDEEDSTKRLASLVALSSLIKSTPKATYAAELPALIPLLIRGLELPDPEIRSNVIETFLAAAEGDSPDKSLVSEHTSTLLNAMLKNCIVSEMPSPKVRISALRYLGRLPGIVRSNTLNRYRAEVIRELGKVLDDPKRSVRKEAVDARAHWFKYSG